MAAEVSELVRDEFELVPPASDLLVRFETIRVGLEAVVPMFWSLDRDAQDAVIGDVVTFAAGRVVVAERES